MLYSEKVKLFAKQHPCEEITVDGARYRYVLCGKAGARTLVFLNGGRFCGARGENSSDSSQSGLLFKKMQKDLIALMHDPKIAYVSGGHLSTVLKTQDYVRVIREFLTETFA